MPKKIIIVRHGETQDNVDRRFQGWIDTPLNEAGLAQARIVAKRLREEVVAAIYTSDLIRAKATAEIIAAEISAPVMLRQELRENDMGKFAGWQWEKEKDPYLESLWHELEESRKKGDPNWKKHGGESHTEHLSRTKKFLAELEANHPDESVVVVTHGGSINRIMEIVGYSDWMCYVGYGNTSITIMEKSSTNYIVTLHNDTSHLSESAKIVRKSNDQ